MKPATPDLPREHPHHGDSRFWDRQLRARIGQDLRAIFEGSLSEPLPERISRVLGRIEGGADTGRQQSRSES